MTTFAPAFAAVRAAFGPADPAPITATSNSCMALHYTAYHVKDFS